MSGPDARVALNNGVRIPWLGLGTYMATGGAVYDAVTVALEAGYRHFDTAAFYDNEREVGAAIRDSGIPRDHVFVTTKLWNSDHGAARARRAFERSAAELDLGPIDLYLLHWPVPELRRASWTALEELYDEGLCRAIGVSNYTIRHLEELLGHAEIVPAVNQVELSPFLVQRDLVGFCDAATVRVEAYSPLTKTERLGDRRLRALAETVGRTPAQVLIRWCLQREVVVIPKSTDPGRIRENAAVFDFELSSRAMDTLDALDEGLRTSWDPTDEP